MSWVSAIRCQTLCAVVPYQTNSWIENIGSIRFQTIDSLLEVFRQLIQHLIVVDEGPRLCHHASWLGPHRCESMMLGSLTFCLSRAGLWPLPDTANVKDSISDLHFKLNAVVIQDLGQVKEDMRDHKCCNPSKRLSEAVVEIMTEISMHLAKITFRTGQIDLAR